MSESAPEGSPIHCFLSYAHGDEDVLNFVDHFKNSLEHFCWTNNGRKVEIFLDHESIGWGEEWEQKIGDAVQMATVFISLVSVVYLDRPMCRKEVMLFFEKAKALGVTELFLPAVFLGHDVVRTRSASDPVAKNIVDRQYKDIRVAVIEGNGTAAWRRAMIELADSLVAAVDTAESKLESMLRRQTEAPSQAGRDKGPEDDDSPGLMELSESAVENVERINELIVKLVDVMENIQRESTGVTPRLQGADQARGKVLLLGYAHNVGPLAQRVEEIGKEVEESAARADESLRAQWNLVQQSGLENYKAQMVEQLQAAADNATTLSEMQDVIDEMLNESLALEVLSVPLRKSLRPLRNGVSSVKSAVSIMQSWPDLPK